MKRSSRLSHSITAFEASEVMFIQIREMVLSLLVSREGFIKKLCFIAALPEESQAVSSRI